MEKYILKTDEATANALAALIEAEVLPLVASLADQLAALGIVSDAKQRIAEIFAGNYGQIEAECRAALEKDAALFQSPSAKGEVLGQLNGIMADIKEFVTKELARISGKDVGGFWLADPAILDYMEFKKGVPVVTNEHKAAILERYTTYVQTEAAADIHKAHREAVAALDGLWKSCERAGVQLFLPVQFFNTFFRHTDDGMTAAEIDYDNLVDCAATVAANRAEKVDKEIRHTLPTEQKAIILGGGGKIKCISAAGTRQ